MFNLCMFIVAPMTVDSALTCSWQQLFPCQFKDVVRVDLIFRLLQLLSQFQLRLPSQPTHFQYAFIYWPQIWGLSCDHVVSRACCFSAHPGSTLLLCLPESSSLIHVRMVAQLTSESLRGHFCARVSGKFAVRYIILCMHQKWGPSCDYWWRGRMWSKAGARVGQGWSKVGQGLL